MDMGKGPKATAARLTGLHPAVHRPSHLIMPILNQGRWEADGIVSASVPAVWRLPQYGSIHRISAPIPFQHQPTGERFLGRLPRKTHNISRASFAVRINAADWRRPVCEEEANTQSHAAAAANPRLEAGGRLSCCAFSGRLGRRSCVCLDGCLKRPGFSPPARFWILVLPVGAGNDGNLSAPPSHGERRLIHLTERALRGAVSSFAFLECPRERIPFPEPGLPHRPRRVTPRTGGTGRSSSPILATTSLCS
ncbi:hypothetical protein B0T25DRAFT_103098 [Lasiosphaeria hispida]|uniref:Uncharacterized protein n=1 Tax=Lasiosphaeria hispida TaxID=260671 RepID=A0AAJ0HQR5_9PEZI|nr:hypothetical protein B0T25DRAFT_103098 [Lasiosphaeria hispida]